MRAPSCYSIVTYRVPTKPGQVPVLERAQGKYDTRAEARMKMKQNLSDHVLAFPSAPMLALSSSKQLEIRRKYNTGSERGDSDACIRAMHCEYLGYDENRHTMRRAGTKTVIVPNVDATPFEDGSIVVEAIPIERASPIA